MSLTGFLVLLVIAALCGAIGQALAGYSLGGCLVSAVVGVIGAYLGYWVATQFGLPELFVVQDNGEPFPILWSIIGSAIFEGIVGFLTRRRVYP